MRSASEVGDEAAVGDDHDVVDCLGDFSQEVARDEDRAAVVGEVAQELPQPVDSFGVESVGRLVEDQNVGFAQERTREGEALTHSEREGLDTTTAGVGEADLGKDGVDARERQSGRDGEHAQVIAGSAAGMEGVGLEHRADPAERLRRAV